MVEHNADCDAGASLPPVTRYRITSEPDSRVRCRYWLQQEGRMPVARLKELLDAVPDDADVHLSWFEWTEDSTPDERQRWADKEAEREAYHLDWHRKRVLDKFGVLPDHGHTPPGQISTRGLDTSQPRPTPPGLGT